jgi:hypothetical protein
MMMDLVTLQIVRPSSGGGKNITSKTPNLKITTQRAASEGKIYDVERESGRAQLEKCPNKTRD